MTYHQTKLNSSIKHIESNNLSKYDYNHQYNIIKHIPSFNQTNHSYIIYNPNHVSLYKYKLT